MAARKKDTGQAEQAPASPPLAETGRPRSPVAGIGASAGGLDAFKKFFAAMPADSGIAFVLIPHLAPAHESLMVELLARCTAMPVVEAAEGMLVEANRVYIIPPNKYLAIQGGSLRLTGPVERSGLQTSIDFFLRSLAEDQQENAICIILSGTGSYGTPGLKAVKAGGGMAMVQDPGTAEYGQMPQSAVATGLADYVLSPEQMPEALIGYVRHFCGSGGARADVAEDAPDCLNQILALLHVHARCDFRSYRKKMLTRRIERRMSLNHIEQLSYYLAYLREHPGEVKRLVKDLLISVTGFFRDPEAFQALETLALAPLVQAREADAPLRAWVSGCATGEEAYSIAMLLLEQLAKANKGEQLQLFATDANEDALEIARQGIYSDSVVADVSPERLERFFTRLDDRTCQVNKTLREAVLFAPQNLLSNAPFSRLDLVSCRNLLIYLEPEVQQKVLALIHFALNEGGYLFLGSSEAIGRQTDLFEVVSKKWRLYRRIGPSRPGRAECPIVPSREQYGEGKHSSQKPPRPRPAGFAELARQSLLEEYEPAAVLIGCNNTILYFHGQTMRYLGQPAGEPTQDLLLLAREGLRTKLRSAVRKAAQAGQRITLPHVRVKDNGGFRSVAVTVKPVPGPHDEKLFLVIFEDEQQQPSEPSAAEAAEEPLVRQLEFELQAAREDLQSTIEEMESSNEELKVSHEEVMSMNEELQSANEELETSKEELQSLNEELATVNSQLRDKVEELEGSNNDLANLLANTDVGTVFLDSSFRIKRYTPAATKLFNLIATDLGRPLTDITLKFTDRSLLRDCERVLRSLAPLEKNVRLAEGDSWYLRRVSPYRTRDSRIEGVVLTFVDVTPLMKASERQRLLGTLLMDSSDAVTIQDFGGKFTAWNRGAERMYGYTEAEAFALDPEKLIPLEQRNVARSLMERLRRGASVPPREMRRVRKDGRVLDVWQTLSALKDEAGNPVAVASTELDISARKRAEAEILQFNAELEQRVAERTAELAAANRTLQREASERKTLEREVLEIAASEQRRIGVDLHDGIGQELTGLSLMAQSLAESLQDKPVPAAETTGKIAAGLQRALKHVRALSRGLVPVEVDAEGLMTALSELTAHTSEQHRVTCTFTCADPVLVENNTTATHLYHIAKEAITNALKHSKATHIQASLEANAHSLTLAIQDNGSGMPNLPASTLGMGLKIMRHRASLVGAALEVGAAEGGGTRVACTLIKDRGHDKKQTEDQPAAGAGPDRR